MPAPRSPGRRKSPRPRAQGETAPRRRAPRFAKRSAGRGFCASSRRRRARTHRFGCAPSGASAMVRGEDPHSGGQRRRSLTRLPGRTLSRLRVEAARRGQRGAASLMGLSGRKDTCLGCSPLDTLSVIKESPHLPKRKPNVVFPFIEHRSPQLFPCFPNECAIQQ